MKAMLYAAGLGSRLGKITETTPKALVSVAGKPMIEHVILRLKAAGVAGIMINLFHLGDQIESFIKDNKSFGIDIRFSREKQLLGTGGGLKNAAHYFMDEEMFFIYNCDIYCELDLLKLAEFHRSNPALATLVTMERETSRHLLFDRENALVGWENDNPAAKSTLNDKIPEKRLAFSGIHIASPRLFRHMEDQPQNFSIITAYMNSVRSGEKVQSYLMRDTFWSDMGKPAALDELRKR